MIPEAKLVASSVRGQLAERSAKHALTGHRVHGVDGPSRCALRPSTSRVEPLPTTKHRRQSQNTQITARVAHGTEPNRCSCCCGGGGASASWAATDIISNTSRHRAGASHHPSVQPKPKEKKNAHARTHML